MRPDSLNPLFADITALPGVGPKIAALVSRVAGPRVVDVLLTLPTSLIDRSARPAITDAADGQLVTLELRVDTHQPPPKGRQKLPYKVICSDASSFLALVFFHGNRDWTRKQLPEGETVLVSGKVERQYGNLQMVHPDYIVSADKADTLPLMEPVYPLTAGLSGKVMRRAVLGALERLPPLPEWHRGDLLAREDWPDFANAMGSVHHPESRLDLQPDTKARQRLAYDELLANQLALRLIRERRRRKEGRVLKGDDSLRSAVRAALPFALTGDQEKVLAEIDADMAAPARMVRLVQGDVGSGKTMVALFAMLTAVEAGTQAVLMAPTEILARQHFETIAPLLKETQVTVELLTGRDQGKEREAKLTGLSAGYIHILIGTHAVFSEDVRVRNLGLVIVDEQHRFGVFQRLALQEKGHAPDVLVMTATPIPRTLALTAYGDMEVSQIREKPPGRKPVETLAMPLAKLDQVIAAVGRAIAKGDQVYWVCPLVEENDMLDLTSVEARFETLKERYGDAVGIVHGQMAAPAKDEAVTRFYRGETKVLVSTTVIEVGVNSPDATVMVIEHSERFGLAQLHQLRGRVGRGDKPATCILLYKAGEDGSLGETAKARLNILRQTEDGFLIAEEDLRLRGAGDILGAMQSGLPRFQMADISVHRHLLEQAMDDARLIVRDDADLKSDRGQALRALLYLFSRDDAVKLLAAG